MPNDSTFPVPGTVLWAVDVDLERDVFRSGAATKPNVEYLRFVDVGIWGIDQKHPIPSGLQLLYDGQPPGHCTLSVARRMTIGEFLSLVSQIPFSPRGTYLLVRIP